MERGSLDVLRDFRLGHRLIHVVRQHVLAVVEDEDGDLRVLGLDLGPQVRPQEGRFLLRGEGARLPPCVVARLVLHREAPDGKARFAIGSDPLRDVCSPRRLCLASKAWLTRAVHLAGCLHPGGRAPGGGEQAELLRGLRGHELARLTLQRDRPVAVLHPREAGPGGGGRAAVRAHEALRGGDEVLPVRALEGDGAVLILEHLEERGAHCFEVVGLDGPIGLRAEELAGRAPQRHRPGPVDAHKGLETLPAARHR
mmetsp:Transcript_143576/g.357813  ORF Transcript_143576/g.357813 Transcript_143576/m.357813 type:complete len:255 (+) Transcript_143576:646-1410(+)